ncbi:DUF4233 domain-containing protein [Saccharopolyspora erythraea]|uniref:DUF4233 domain-containing protein n=1 Tax=Saccharopolyspora erythraea TaxID=1836 RepID=UPI001BA9F87C|nr:DUF4233 domain-containing protein [Saccharopolyspora erythraea]QUH00991.1 DUF4233 domain-containing protein [Saccharopolyspora erythraea]
MTDESSTPRDDNPADVASGDRAGDASLPEDQYGLPVPPEGVRDPWKGLRGIMAATLILEFIVFALALPVVWQFAGGVSSAGFVFVAVLSVLLLVAGFVQRRKWGLGFALVLQVALVACFFVHPAIGLMALVFVVVWAYIVHLRRDVAKRMRHGQLYDQLGHPPGYPPERA